MKSELLMKIDKLWFIQSILVIHFSHLSEKFVDTTPVEIFHFCHVPFIGPAFTYSNERKRCSATADLSIQTSDNRKKPSLVAKPHELALPSLVLPTCCEPVLPYVIEHFQVEK